MVNRIRISVGRCLRYDGRVIVATHVAATGDSAGGGDCAVDHDDAATAALCFKNYFRINTYIVS